MADAIAYWLPIEFADKAIVDVATFSTIGITIRNSQRYWVRDEDGRTYEAVWTDHRSGYWWDLEDESPVDPVQFMPHPLDPRWADAGGDYTKPAAPYNPSADFIATSTDDTGNSWESIDLTKRQIDQLCEVVKELKFALFSSDMAIKDRADQAARLILDATTSKEPAE